MLWDIMFRLEFRDLNHILLILHDMSRICQVIFV